MRRACAKFGNSGRWWSEFKLAGRRSPSKSLSDWWLFDSQSSKRRDPLAISWFLYPMNSFCPSLPYLSKLCASLWCTFHPKFDCWMVGERRPHAMSVRIVSAQRPRPIRKIHNASLRFLLAVMIDRCRPNDRYFTKRKCGSPDFRKKINQFSNVRAARTFLTAMLLHTSLPRTGRRPSKTQKSVLCLRLLISHAIPKSIWGKNMSPRLPCGKLTDCYWKWPFRIYSWFTH